MEYELDFIKYLMNRVETIENDIQEVMIQLVDLTNNLNCDIHCCVDELLPIEIEEIKELLKLMNQLEHALSKSLTLLKNTRTPIDKQLKR